MDKVIGDDYRKPLVDFEKSKLDELEHYINLHSGPNCISVMHNRLL